MAKNHPENILKRTVYSDILTKQMNKVFIVSTLYKTKKRKAYIAQYWYTDIDICSQRKENKKKMMFHEPDSVFFYLSLQCVINS